MVLTCQLSYIVKHHADVAIMVLTCQLSYIVKHHADVAQLVEQYFRKVEVPGSNPGIGSITLQFAGLVQW